MAVVAGVLALVVGVLALVQCRVKSEESGWVREWIKDPQPWIKDPQPFIPGIKMPRFFESAEPAQQRMSRHAVSSSLGGRP